MFVDFFFTLRQNKIPVTPTEFLDFLKTLEHRCKQDSPLDSQTLYSLGRYTLVKDLKHYDAYDLAFAQTFASILREGGTFRDQLEQWLNAAKQANLDAERRRKVLQIPPEELLRELKKRWQEQKERHDGGNYWVGTGGTSPFGHGGYNPQGIRIGGEGAGRSGIASALSREYQEYRTDEALNIRQIKLCLKRLRILKKQGRKELSIPKTIKETCGQGGDITPVMASPRRNQMKVLLMADVGGSMTPHSLRVSRLFSACHQMNHFKEFKSYYFHNIIYDHVYADAAMEQSLSLEALFRRYDKQTRVIILGDAAMAPYELFQMSGPMNALYRNFLSVDPELWEQQSRKKTFTAYERLRQIIENFPHLIWLNPDHPRYWQGETVEAIKRQVPMYFLSFDGLMAGIDKLLSKAR